MKTDNHAHERRDSDVIIVGAGPIGLTLACALAQHGVDFRIFESKSGQSGDSKGHVLNTRSQELLAAVGALDAIAAKSYRPREMQMLLDGKPFARLAPSGADSPHDAGLLSHQGIIESELAATVESRGNSVERNRPVKTVTPDEAGVAVEVGYGDTRPPERLRCCYLVGADGAAGTVRKAVGLDFKAERLPDRAIRQVDARLRWRRSTAFDQAWFFLFPNGFAGVMPVWEGVYRLFFIEDEALVPDRPPTLDEMVARARQVTGDETFSMSDPVWFSHGRFSHGVSPAYRSGRVFLAGDAGHTTLPIGGQGMNAGLHDAVGLGWRLAMTLAGDAGPMALDSYSPERHGAHAELGREQVRGFKQLMYRGRVADVALATVADLVPNLATRVLGGIDVTQLSLAYPDSPLSEDHGMGLSPFHGKTPHAGSRAPDARLVSSDGAVVRLFDTIYNPDGRSWGWRLFLFDGRDPDARKPLERASDSVAAWSWVRPLWVLANPARNSDSARDPMHLVDLDGVAHRAYGVEGAPALFLIRPDGHIAFRGGAAHPERLVAYCGKVSGRTA